MKKRFLLFTCCLYLYYTVIQAQTVVNLPDYQLYGANLFSFTQGDGVVYALGMEPGLSNTENSYGIYQYDGNNWSTVVTGIKTTGNMVCLKYWNGKLYLGGSFTALGGNVNANQVVAYYNGHFEAVGHGISNNSFSVVHCFAVYNNQLLAGGCFDTDGYAGSQPLVQWNGSNWVSYGPYIYDSACIATSIISEMFVDENRLYVRGNFTKSGNTTLNHVAWYENGNFNAMGNGLPCAWVTTHHDCFCKIGGSIYALLDSSSNSQRGIMQWNGTAWSTLLPLRENQLVSQLFNYNDTLYIAGGTWYQQPDFWGAVVTNGLAAENPYNLQSGSAVGYYFNLNGQLYLKGYFYLPGDNTMYTFGKFGAIAGVQQGEEVPVQVYPNPFTNVLQITGPVKNACLTDMAGHAIPVESTGAVLNTGHLPAGAYILQWQSSSGTKQVKVYKAN